jgi:hypothetical protein
MPRVTTEVAETPLSMVASAARMTGTSVTNPRPKQSWQKEAWHFYDTCGELRYAANWMGNVLSRATLRAVQVDVVGGEEREVTSGPAFEALEELCNGREGQAAMLKSIGIHFFVAGECYLIGRSPDPKHDEMVDAEETLWEVASTEEVTQNGKQWQVDYHDGTGAIPLGEDDVVIRLWMPHPRRHKMADSPVRAQLANLRELELLSRHVAAQARSRLAGNGVLFLPSSIQFPTPPNPPEGVTDSASLFQWLLMNAMMESVEDPSDPAALVPIIVTADGESIANIEHKTFWSEYDAKISELRSEAIRRLALGLDIPAEVMLGTADMNHWSAWQVEESSIKVSVEPMLASIARSLTTGYLRPVTDNTKDAIAFDTSKLRMRPNRSREAIELSDRLALSNAALRRETGFDESDAPEPDELKHMLLMRIAGGSATPEQVAQALNALGISEVTGEGETTRESRPSPSLQDHPSRDIPEPQAAAASLLDKSEVLVFRALERAGNRLRSLKQTRPPCAAADTYMFVKTDVGELDKVLDDAWTCLDRVIPQVPDFHRKTIASALDTYCRHLLLQQVQYDRTELQHYLTTVPMREIA